MHHLYPTSGKGDSLCPLGFHPQVRWPTRCKRCFRDYKEHGGRRSGKEDITASSPSLSSWSSQPQMPQASDNTTTSDKSSRQSWSSSSNVFIDDKYRKSSDSLQNRKPITNSQTVQLPHRPASWTSTPDLGNIDDDAQANIPTFHITLPRKRITTPASIDTGQKPDVEKAAKLSKIDLTSTKSKKSIDSTAERTERSRTVQVKEVNEAKKQKPDNTTNDVQFLIQVKSKTYKHDNKDSNSSKSSTKASIYDDDVSSIAGTETTETTLVDRNDQRDSELLEQIESLKQELETVKARCDKAEREKSDLLLRRLASYESTSSKTTASEVLKLQQKNNELQTQLGDLKDEKRSLNSRIREIESELENRPNSADVQKQIDELKSKLLAAETLCEELMDENEDMKKEMRELEEEMEEMQDNFREDQADEYTSLKKELEQTTKNCRILSFKLRKTERKVEELETAKLESEKKLKDLSTGTSALDNIEKIKRLEQDLKVANEVANRLQKELEETNAKLIKSNEDIANKKPGTKDATTKKKAPTLASIGKTNGEKMSRESLTRGGSQDDPVQLLRDLQDCLEREADLREQLKFAEEEAEILRKKVSRIEEDNESLVMQLKKMASKSRGRKLSPSSTTRFIPQETALDKDEGISEDDDPSELKLLLELSEQEALVLRRKVEDMEVELDTTKRKLKDTQAKLGTRTNATKKTTINTTDAKGTSVQDQKMKVLEDETCDLRKKLIQKERDCERLYAELSITQKRTKGMQKSKSLDGDQQTLDLKRQLQVVEQEAVVLQSKLQNLETENEKLMTENKKLLLLTNRNVKKSNTDLNIETNDDRTSTKEKELEASLSAANAKINELNDVEKTKQEELDKIRKLLSEVESKNKDLENRLLRLESPSEEIKKTRTPKKPSELSTKLALKNMVLDLEKEIGDILVNMKKVEDAKQKAVSELKQLKANEKQVKEIDDKIKEETSNEIAEMKKQIKTMSEYKESFMKEKTKADGLSTKLTTANTTIKNLEKEKTEIQNKLKKSEMDHEKLVTEQEKKLKTLIETEKKLEELQKELDELRKREKDKEKLDSKLSDQNKTIQENEKRFTELEEKLKKTEALLTKHKEKAAKLEKEKQKLTTGGSKTAEELTTLKLEYTEVKKNLENTLRDKKILEDKLLKLENESRNDTLSWEKKASELESDLLMERKKVERMRANYEKQQKNQQLELTSLKDKIKNLENGTISNESKLANKELTNELAKVKQQYDDLTTKYELLEEEHVGTKAKLVMEKEEILSQLSSVEIELKAVRDDRENLYKRYADLQEQIRELNKSSQQTTEMDRNRLKATETKLEQQLQELDRIKKESDVLNDQFNNLRKENEDLKQKLDDFHKVSKIQRNMNADNTALDKELAQLKAKFAQSEKAQRADLAECKIRYEGQINSINDQLQSVQNQAMKFKRERDMFKHMLESAQRTLGELKNAQKSGLNIPSSASSSDEAEDYKMKLASLEQQVSCLEDELSEARLESTKAKTELVSERSTWEVKLAEMKSRINELEEDRLMTSGRLKVVGMRTRMELAWQKEREEQQRLLQETSTLARDLRQTLFEVERERDKERLEAKRKLEQLKKASEEEVDETRKKLSEVQCDLLELRDAHAKLRTTNEKLRREKEKNERERDELKSNLNSKKKLEQDEQRVNFLLDQVEKLLQMVPEAQDSRPSTPTPPRRQRASKSRESSPGITGSLTNRRSIERELQYNLQKLKDAVHDVQQNKTRPKMRRANSSEKEAGKHSVNGQRVNRRSLSLEPGNRAGSLADDQANMWSRSNQNSDSISSLQSLDKMSDVSGDLRYYSMDSRLSGGSTQSEVITSVDSKKKKKGLMSALKKLTKSRSVDDQSDAAFYKHSAAGSDSSIGTEEGSISGSKVDLKERITGIFRRGGSASRSNSLERKIQVQDTSSLQRPIKISSRPSPGPDSRSSSVETNVTLRNPKLSSQTRPSPAPSEKNAALSKPSKIQYKK